jgi:hypothetical protein
MHMPWVSLKPLSEIAVCLRGAAFRKGLVRTLIRSLVLSLCLLPIVASCSTVPRKPLAPGDMRLLSVDVPQSGSLSANVEYFVTIDFEANGNPEIRRACCYAGGRRECFNIRPDDVTYVFHPSFRVPIHVPLGSSRLVCYVEYVTDGETRRTNTVGSYIVGYERD